ncbi:peptidoglycan/xylan/chitin deacetylase (PgdA/CDA1 family) [Lipingzhangella halophila]|uniref:Peptidoglycan/xylan/chitin deacetylase (PgdA/CDA1 family) n=1 Tax=Lipingzhangella halophila TaxID=1783352 RepID=A0A7W7RID2_9ACTN|nr:polysaccharide deacetylase family protein [Lipingzhangella halophila]MBB4932567.1 peptidoglycan/xylan/chitin deacetylase (PgdA/CDA1 family) [Lipingzhangella halophila]
MFFRASTPAVTSPPTARPLGIPAATIAILTLAGCSIGEGDQSSGSEEIKPDGDPDQLTVVAPENVTGISEVTNSEDGDVLIETAYPEIPNADPLTEQLGTIIERETSDFVDAYPDAKAFTVDWNLSVAGDGIVAVRLVRTEEDADGEHTRYATYYYDATEGGTGYSTELLAGQQELDALNDLVSENLEGQEDVDTAKLYPIMRLYDSVGFNPEGDLVVEFDSGEVAPEDAGRISAVIDQDDAAPLLSEFGERAQSAATVVTPDFEITRDSPKSGAPSDPVPGVLPVRDDSVDCSTAESKCIALTFDDGPGERTPELLDALAEHDAKATFFLTGEPLRENVDTLRREYAEGHEIANHTETHPNLTTIGSGEVEDELTPVNALVRRETGHEMTLMRPPYGATDDSSAAVSKDLGLAEILWSVDTNDWRDRNAGKVASHTVKHAKPGSIVLMHDIHGTTIDAVPRMLEKLTNKGFTMVTVSQLLGETEPGEEYRDGHPDKDKDKDDKDKDEKDDKDEDDA